MDLAQLGESFGQLMNFGQVQAFHCLHKNNALLISNLIQLFQLLGSNHGSLLADDIFAVLQQSLCCGIMECIGVGNIYCIDIAFAKCIQIIIDSGDAVLRAKCLTLCIAERINRGMHKIRCIFLCAFEEGIYYPTSADCRKFNHVTLLLALLGHL